MEVNKLISKDCVVTSSSSILRTFIWAFVFGVVSVNLLRQERNLHRLKSTNLSVEDLTNHVSRRTEECSNNMTNVDEAYHEKEQILHDIVPGIIASSEKDEYVVDFSHGIEPIYLDLLQKAKRRSALDFETSHVRGDKGVVIGPTDGKFHFTLDAMKNAKRIRYILDGDNSIKVALMTSTKHIEIIQQKCSFGNTTRKFEFACRLWANGTLFDDVIETKDGEFKTNDNHTSESASSNHWLKALGGYRHAPYTRSLFLDSDALPCPGFQDLFTIVRGPDHGYNPWQLTSSRSADVAIGIDQYPSGDLKSFWTPGDPKVLSDFETFRERNTGTVLFHFERQLAHTFTHFIPLVSEHVYNNVATPVHKVVNDQCPFRIALYLFKRLHPDFNEQIIPMHSSCRAYPGQGYAGTDGFLVGMLPKQQDGEYCNECSCSPCRVAHFGLYDLYLNGKMGWEKSIDPNLNITDSLQKGKEKG